MHAIRKLCENSPWNREKVGMHCVDQILRDLKHAQQERRISGKHLLMDGDREDHTEYIKSIILLFDVLLLFF